MVKVFELGKPAFILAWLALFSFSSAGQKAAAPDLIILNGKIRTMTSPNAIAEAVAIAGNKITAVGTSRQISRLARPKTRVVDARGRLVLPGFNDSHVHFMALGNMFSSIDLRNVTSSDEAATRIKLFTEFLPIGRWVLGGHWGLKGWLPAREAVDPVAPDHPVFIYHSNAKVAFANGLALKLAKISRETKPPPGGTIEKDPSGEPTGILHGTAIELVKCVVPAGHTANWIEVAETATNYAASLGVTSLTDTQSDDHAAVYRQLERDGKLKTRIYDCVSLFDRPNSKAVVPADRDPEKMVRTGCVKGFSDGEADEATNLLAKVREADRQGYQVLLHAIGPDANLIVLDTFEKAVEHSRRRTRRFRIEHAHNASGIPVSRFEKTAVIASVQPHLFHGAPIKSETFRDLADARIPIAFGADAPMTELDPLLGIRAAVRSPNGEKGMSVFDAVAAYTTGSAFAEFQESAKGTIALGKLADLVILSDDIFNVPPDRIAEAKVVMTVVNGRIVYESAKAHLQK